MKVSELIEKLKEFDPEATVLCDDEDEWWDVYLHVYIDEKSNYVIINRFLQGVL